MRKITLCGWFNLVVSGYGYGIKIAIRVEAYRYAVGFLFLLFHKKIKKFFQKGIDKQYYAMYNIIQRKVLTVYKTKKEGLHGRSIKKGIVGSVRIDGD